jgi:hypothetical protein
VSVEWKLVEGAPKPFEGDEELGWAPLPGSQVMVLVCPTYELLYEGTRGPGKTVCMLVDFAKECGKGYGADWRGILFRRTFPELEDVVAKSRELFPLIWPSARYNEGKHYWEWPDGERLYFGHFDKPRDYWKYHGHQYL